MKLIINADDAGIDVSRNQGIFDAMKEGVVASISVIVNQGGWEDIIKRTAINKNVCAGLHLNLTAGKPLSKNASTLVNKEGLFYNKFDLFERAMQGKINSEEAAGEFKAQLEMLQEAGIRPTHIDGHNHVYLLPGCREGFLKVFFERTFVRIPFENKNVPVNPNGFKVMEIFDHVERLVSVLNYLSVEAKELWGNRFRYVDDFTGTKVTAHPTMQAFEQAVNELDGQICELMCHPGGPADEHSVAFSKLKERQAEFEILKSEEFKRFLERKKIDLISFKDLLSG